MTIRRAVGSLLLATLASLISGAVGARETFHDLDVKAALESSTGKAKLLDIPVYMAGDGHTAIAADLGVFTSNRRTNSFNKSDEQACQIAFLSAIIALQKRASKMSADAVIDIISITKHKNLKSEENFRCVAGNVVANVALKGRIVKFE